MNELKSESKPGPPRPGEFIRREVIEPLDLSAAKAASILGVPRHALRDVINGSVALSPRLALRIELAFGTPMEQLLGMQMACDIAAEREKKSAIKIERYRPGFKPRMSLTADIAGGRPDMAAFSFLPLCARVPSERIEAAWNWARLSDHPECRYAVWSIARHHARAPAQPVTSHAIIIRHLSIITTLFDDHEGGILTLAALPEPGLFHCEITTEAMNTGHPEMAVLAHRILRARAEIERTLTDDRLNLYTDIAKNTDSIRKQKNKLDFTEHAVPSFDELLTAEERAYIQALAWAAGQAAGSEAHELFCKIQRRADSLAARKRRQRLPSNSDNKSYYVYKSGTLYVWYRKLARLYLESPSTP